MTQRRLKEIARLSRRRSREEAGQFVVEGMRSVESAVAAGAELSEIVVSEEAAADQRLQKFLAQATCPVYHIANNDFARIADTRSTQGVLAVAAIRRRAAYQIEPPAIVLDGVQDPGNVGAVIRVAAWFGASSVLIGPGTADPFSPKAARASMGGIWDLDIAETEDLVDALTDLRSRDMRISGADLTGRSAQEWQPPRESVLVIGSEAHGISEGVLNLLDDRVRIEGNAGSAGVESLNAAVAAGILLFRWLG